MTPIAPHTHPGAGGSYVRLPDGTLELQPYAPSPVDEQLPAIPEKTATPAPKD